MRKRSGLYCRCFLSKKGEWFDGNRSQKLKISEGGSNSSHNPHGHQRQMGQQQQHSRMAVVLPGWYDAVTLQLPMSHCLR